MNEGQTIDIGQPTKRSELRKRALARRTFRGQAPLELFGSSERTRYPLWGSERSGYNEGRCQPPRDFSR